MVDKREEGYKKAVEEKAEANLRYIAAVIDENLEKQAADELEEARHMVLPDRLNSRLKKTKESLLFESKRRRRKRRIIKIVKISILLLAAVTVVSFITIPEVQAIRERIYRFFVEEEGEDYAVINFNDVNADQVLPDEWKRYYYPEWLPEGTALISAKKVGNEYRLAFSDGKQTIYFNQKEVNDKEMPMLVDMEFTETGVLDHDGDDITWYAFEGCFQLYWRNENSTFYIKTDGSLSEAEKIAENIHLMQK